MRGEKFLHLFLSIFTVVGIGMLIGGITILFFNQKFMSGAEKVNGVIDTITTHTDSDGETGHFVYVSYEYGGTEYESVRLGFYSSNMREGQEIMLYCDPDNPKNIATKWSNLFAGIILIFMGIIFAATGIVPVLISIHKAAIKKKLRTAGKILYAVVEKIEYDTNYTVNGRHPRLVYCSYRDDYRDITYRFKSERIWVDLDPLAMTGSAIKVYVEENNYKNYFVDTEGMVQGKIVDYT